LPGLVLEQTRPATVTTPSVPIADPTRPYTPPPDYLNPVANPLQFPTKPEEVTLIGTQPITLAQALELARRNSRSLQVIELQVQSSRLAVREARAAELPSVNLNGTVSYTDSASAELSNRRRDPNSLAALLGQQNQSTTSSSLSGTIEVTYSLDTSGGRSAAIAAAERQLRINELEYERQLEILRLDVTTDYYALQEADQQVEIAKQAVRNAEQSLKDAKALEEAGVGTRFDVLRSEVQLANAKQDLVRAISAQRVSRRQLAQRLSIPQSIDIAAADPVAIAGLWSLSLEDSIIMAFKNRPELEQQLVQRELSEKQRDLALASIRPQVSLFANYSVLDQFDDNIGSADGYAIGARVNWTLYDGGASVARAQQREQDIAIAETRFADIRNQIRFQVEQAYSNLQANFENIQTAALAVEQAEESLRLARLRFQAGVGTQTEVINAETELTRAQVNRLRAILDYNRALASLQRAISNLAAGSSTSPASN
ncbi:MAG: TolC family protein, partial [Cyanobacteria bacterium]|nr:TolC family protein [Cyanobacteriota bacterium]MDW8202237.1 TolC family protein [Cyanobacteriota bacterium SKYGB_h_bin112]